MCPPLALFCVGALVLVLAGAARAPAAEPFRITVVDEETGRGVPLVELKTTNQIAYYTDSAGVVAFDEPRLMDQRVFFHVRSHGYEFQPDGFGMIGRALDVTPGGSATLKIRRINLAERLYRVTGGGIYRDSVLLGDEPPVREPLLNAQVLGSDSVVNAVYRGKYHWFWGDTNRPAYPLGNFDVPGATSVLPADGRLDPSAGVNLDYYTARNGFAKPTAPMPGEGPTWIDALTVLRDGERETMLAAYVKIRPPLTVYERGLCRWNDEREEFEQIARLPADARVRPAGNPFHHTTGGSEHVYFATAYPLVRVRATVEDFTNLESYEAYTCLKAGSRLDDPQIDRTADGQVRYAWKHDTPPVGPNEEAKLIKAGHLKPREGLLQLRDRDTGKPVRAQAGSVYWNAFRNRWVMIVSEQFGSSFLGEVWYAEADSPVGPWAYAVKVVTHDDYSFYNPKQHPIFDQDGGRTIFFEGTYTHSFSGNEHPTPRYDYNQIMYKLDLTRPGTVLPVAVYDESEGQGTKFRTGLDGRPADFPRRIAFFAPDRPAEDTVPVVSAGDRPDARLQLGNAADVKARAVFYAFPPDVADPPDPVVPLYEFRHRESGTCRYSTNKSWEGAGFQRQPQPVCRVWPSPWDPVFATKGKATAE